MGTLGQDLIFALNDAEFGVYGGGGALPDVGELGPLLGFLQS